MTAENNGLFNEVLEKLKKHKSWVILCHENPDGDTLGSAFALYSLGKREGKSVMIVSPDSLPDTFSFFPHAAELRVTKSLPAEEVRNALLAAVDISTEKRAQSNMPELLSACADSVNIDHHGDNTMFAATNLVVPSASATAEIITALLSAYGKGITEGEASALYTSLVTDNG
ncbi:DHH family phosphoesterase, partial [Cloacibacillus sp.]|uniref:DHH family phosphoesterase n=1 Tax=Cloacibacillus sp. TaxID=2049023 RepID=UPI0025C129E8